MSSDKCSRTEGQVPNTYTMFESSMMLNPEEHDIDLLDYYLYFIQKD